MKLSHQRFGRHLIAAALLAGFGAAAIAQMPTPAAGFGGHRAEMREARHHGHGRMDPARMQQRMEERFAQRQARLKKALNITTAQEGAWQAWSAAVKPQPRPAGQRPDRAEFERMTTPQRIDRMRAMQAERAQRMEQRGNATKTFYAALNPQQQSTFDALAMRFAGGKHRGGHEGHGRAPHRSHGEGPGTHAPRG